MNRLDIDWDAAPGWAQWAARDANGKVHVYRSRPYANDGARAWSLGSRTSSAFELLRQDAPDRYWAATCVRRPQTVTIHQDNDGAGMLRAQIGHLLEDMTAEQLDALYAHVRKQLDAAKFDELNRQLDKPFGEVPREWQLKAFEAALDGNTVLYWAEDIEDERAGDWCPLAPLAGWSKAARYRIEPKQS